MLLTRARTLGLLILLTVAPATAGELPAGNALRFDGEDDFATIRHHESLDLLAMTLEAWVYLEDSDSQEIPFFSKGRDFGNYYLGVFGVPPQTPTLFFVSLNFAFENGNFVCCAGGPITRGAWFHVAATFRGDEMYTTTAFVNGAPMGPFSFNLPFPFRPPLRLDAPLLLGRALFASAPEQFLRGRLDEVRVWNIERTAAEVLEAVHCRLGPSTPGLVGYWTFDEDLDDPNITDRSAFQNHGFLGSTPATAIDDPERVFSEVSLVICTAPPVASAGVDRVEECQGDSQATVVLDGTATLDPDSSLGTQDDIIAFRWLDIGAAPFEVGTGETLEVTLPLGTHRFLLEVTDRQGSVSEDEVTITVQDTTPPELAVTLTPDTLWPPNHRLGEVEAQVSASDLCSTPTVILDSVQSDEPDDAPGDGDGRTLDDIQGADNGTADFVFQLRAERAGTGQGRTYTVIYRATDGSGNMTDASATVFVAHDLGGVTEPLMLSARENEIGTVLIWDEVSGALFYNVVRGEVGNLKDLNGSYHLGSLTCIGSATTQMSTVGLEDGDLLPLGEGFFYLVAYDDGSPSGYGTESAAKERFVPPGQDCR